MYKLSRIFMMLTAVLCAFILLGSTLAAAAGGTEMETAVSTSMWDTQFSSPPTGNGIDGEVIAMVEDGNGNLYVGGAFHQVGSTTAHNIAMWDGSSWHALVDGNGYNGLSGGVWSLAIDPASGDVYAGGVFARIDGNNAGPLACRIARWSPSASTWSTLTDSSGFFGTDGTVHALAVVGTKLFVGGSFDGVATSGSCGTLNVTAPGIASWNISSSSWSDVNGSMGSLFPKVNALTTDGSNLYAGGWFDMAGTSSAANVAKWNGSNWSALSSGLNNEVKALTWDNGTLYAGGAFDETGSGSSANYIARWNGTNWAGLGSGMSGICTPIVYAVLAQGNDVYAGGHFQSAGGIAANNIAHWDETAQAWTTMGGGLGIEPVVPCEATDYVGSLAADVIAGGTFVTAGGVDSYHVARWQTISYGVSLSPETAVSAGEPGETVTYTLQVKNTGSQADTFTLTVEGANFPTQLSKSSVGPLAAHGSEAIAVTVNIPGSAGEEDSDTATIVAMSQGDPDVQASSQLTTNIAIPTELTLTKNDGGITAVPSDTIPYTLTYNNMGGSAVTNVTLNETVPPHTTFNAAASSAGWSCADNSPAGTACQYAVGSIGAGNGGTAVFGVTLDSNVIVTMITNTAVLTDNSGASIPASDNTPILLTGIVGQKFNDYNGDGHIAFPRDYDVASMPETAAFGDINNDGHLDILIMDDIRYRSLLFGRGDGSFAPDIKGFFYDPDGLWLDTKLGDVNGDSILDIVITSMPSPPKASVVAVMLGQGGGNFAKATNFTTGSHPSHLELADLNGDNHLDLIVGAKYAPVIDLFFGTGDGRFPVPNKRIITTVGGVTDMALADLDNDNDLDIVAITSNKIMVSLNDGTGVFTATTYSYYQPEHLSLGDVDGDNDIDILFTAANSATIILNNGNGTFITGTSQIIAADVKDVVLADVNGGNLDLLLAYTNTVAVKAGDGSGMFATPITYAVGSSVVELHVIDVDNDNNLDLITVNNTNNGTISRLFGDGQGGFAVNRFESGLPNWTIFLDDDDDNTLDPGEISQTTDANGFYTFTQSIPGNYQVREVQQSGWQQTTPNITTTIASGQLISNVNIGNFELMTISGTVYYDQNENGIYDGGETAQAGWTILLDDNNNGFQDGLEITATTDINGRYLFANLSLRTLFVREIVPPGWKATTGDLHSLPAFSGQAKTIDFGNAPISISGFKFNDIDGNTTPVQIFSFEQGGDTVASKTGDVNGDGFTDAVILQSFNLLSERISILLGRADGTLQPEITQTVSIHTPSNPGASHNPNDIELADINGDNFDDIIITMWQHPSHSITQVVTLMSQGNGTFGSAVRYESGSSMPQEVELADLTGDGHLDMVVVNSTHGSGGPITDTVSVFINKGDGTGTFKTRIDYFVTGNGKALKLADMDGDNDIDIVVSGQTSTILINNNGLFNTRIDPGVNVSSSYLALSDVDNNGFPDIILSNGIASTALAIFLNNGNGTFGASMGLQLGEGVVLYADEGITAVDINNDNHPDILIPLNNNVIGVFLGDGNGGFSGRKDYPVGERPNSAVVADFDQDGNPDLWVVHESSKDAYLLNGDGQGGFALTRDNGIPNWTIFLDNNGNDILDSGDISTTTNANGQYTFTVPLVNYRLREVNQQDWVQTTISPTNISPIGTDITEVNFGNFKLATITGTVFHDLNGNRLQDVGDSGMNNWVVFMDENQNGILDSNEISTTTAVSGYYSFTQISPSHHYLRVIMPTGWQSSKTMPEIIAPGSGQTANINFGVYQLTTIGDKVWLDSNTDGIQDSGETNGVSGVTTTLHLPTGAVLQTTTTNAAGLYTFTVKPGSYYVSFTLPSTYLFSPQNQGIFGFGDSDADVGTGETAVFTITSGISQPYWDAGMFRLSIIGDRVWNDANYNGIQDSDESGAGGVTVTLYHTGSITPFKTTTTNASGDYSFAVMPGEYWLQFKRPFNHTFTIPDANAEDIDSDADAGGNTIPFTVVENEYSLNWDAGVVELATVGNLVWLDVDADGIRGIEDLGVPGITVTLRNGTGIVDTEITDGDGIYTFTQVIPGNYYIHIAKPTGWAYSPKQNPAAPDTDHDSDVDQTSGETDYMTLNPGQIDLTQDGGMYPLPATIGDRVWHDVDGNGIQDAGEPGIAGATIDLYHVGDTFPDRTTTSDASGAYTFTNVLPNDYFLSFSPPGGYYLTVRDQGGDDTLDSDADSSLSSPTFAQTISFTVSAGDVVTKWDAGVYQLGSIGDYIWLDSNYDGIQDSSEGGLTGVTVTLHSGGFVISTTNTDANGYYTFTNLHPNVYALEVPTTLNHPQNPLSLQDQGNDDTVDSDANPETGKTMTFTLTSGQHLMNWDVGYTRLDDFNLTANQDNDLNGIPDNALAAVTVHLRDLTNNIIVQTQSTKSNGYAFFYGWWRNNDYIMKVEKPIGFLFAPRYLSDIDPATGNSDIFSMGLPIGMPVKALLYQPTNSGNVSPANGETVQFIDGQDNVTAAQFLPHAVTTDTTMYLTNLSAISAMHTLQQTTAVSPTFAPPDGYVTSNHEIYLDAEQEGWQTPNLAFTVPATLTIAYSDEDAVGLDESSLVLFYWDWESDQWLDAGDGCETAVTPHLNTETNTVTTEICQTGRYALFGLPQTGFTVYLPVIMRP